MRPVGMDNALNIVKIFYLKMLSVKEFLSISHWCWKEFTQRCYHAVEIASIF